MIDSLGQTRWTTNIERERNKIFINPFQIWGRVGGVGFCLDESTWWQQISDTRRSCNFTRTWLRYVKCTRKCKDRRRMVANFTRAPSHLLHEMHRWYDRSVSNIIGNILFPTSPSFSFFLILLLDRTTSHDRHAMIKEEEEEEKRKIIIMIGNAS